MSGPDAEPGLSTRLAHAGRDPAGHAGSVSIPPYRTSTVLFPSLDALEARDPDHLGVRYGRLGTPSSHAFEEAMAALEGGHRAVTMGSGLSAITTTLMAFLKAGDHLLMTDSCYGPTREFCDGDLARFGVTTTYYDPLIGGGIAALIRPETRVVFLESPGSITFEVQDVPAIAAAAKARGCVSMIDNTWSAGVFLKPLRLGVDISIQAVTKYVAGHADANAGVAVCTAETWRPVKEMAVRLGVAAGSEDLFLALRGLRTLAIRLERHRATALRLAEWLKAQPETIRLLHPAFPDCPGHAHWARDYTGSCGLFAVEIAPRTRPALAAMLDGMRLFGMGYSWGGFESLILPLNPRRMRTATAWEGRGTLLRLHAGLEDADDLVRDLEDGFRRLREAA